MAKAKVLLTRDAVGAKGDRDGRFGKIVTPSGLQLYSGELPWRDDKAKRSCVPPGCIYLVEMLPSPAHGRDVYHLTKMIMPDGSLAPLPDGRTVIEMHPANLMGDVELGAISQLLGCIALGNSIGLFREGESFKCADGVTRALPQDQQGLTSSGDAIKRFEDDLERKAFELTIVQA